MAVLKAPTIPRYLLLLFKIAPQLTRRLLTAYLIKNPPAWQPLYEDATAGALAIAGLSVPGRIQRIGTLPHRFIADVMFLRNASLKAIKQFPIRVFGNAFAKPKPRVGTVYACLNLGCFYMNFLRPPVGITEILVITPTVPPEEDRKLCHRIEAITGVKLILTEASTRSAIAIARQLKKGGIVATMLDAHISGSPYLVAPFLGKPAATPKGIYEILSRMSANIIPVYNLRTQNGFDVYYESPISTESRSPEAIAADVNERLGKIILDNPEQWSLWAAVPARWNAIILAAQAAEASQANTEEAASPKILEQNAA